MIYTIETKPTDENKLHGITLIEIEFTSNLIESKWYSTYNFHINKNEINESLNNKLSEFYTDIEKLANFRNWLNKRNKPLTLLKEHKRFHEKHLPELIKRIEIICTKYNLFYMVD